MIFVIIFFIRGLIWGGAVSYYRKKKGYRENWFWKGFFFGAFVLLYTWAMTMDLGGKEEYYYNKGEGESIIERDVFREIMENEKANEDIGEWRCSCCKKINKIYVGTCSCGYTKHERNS